MAELELILPRLNIRLLTPQLLRSSSATQPSLQRYSVKRKKSSNGEHIIVFLEKYFLLTISIFSLLSRVQKLQQKDVQISIIKIV